MSANIAGLVFLDHHSNDWFLSTPLNLNYLYIVFIKRTVLDSCNQSVH